MSLVFSLTSLNVVFLVSAVFALIIPIMATIIGKNKIFMSYRLKFMLWLLRTCYSMCIEK
jgi:hypothetical protein